MAAGLFFFSSICAKKIGDISLNGIYQLILSLLRNTSQKVLKTEQDYPGQMA